MSAEKKHIDKSFFATTQKYVKIFLIASDK